MLRTKRRMRRYEEGERDCFLYKSDVSWWSIWTCLQSWLKLLKLIEHFVMCR